MRRAANLLFVTGLILAGGALLWSARSADAQSGSRSGGTGRSVATVQSSQPTFENRLWRWLKTVHYENWAPGPGQDSGFYEGQSPHGAFLKMYLNRTAAANSKKLPNGSIMIKENYGPDSKTLMAITVMYRSTGYNPEAGDWYWVKYRPDGTVDRTPPEQGSMRLAGKVPGCIKCHSGADGDDHAFIND